MNRTTIRSLAWIAVPLVTGIALASWKTLDSQPDDSVVHRQGPTSVDVQESHVQHHPLGKESHEEQSPAAMPVDDDSVSAYDTVTAPNLDAVVSENRRLAETNRKLNGQLVDTLNWILDNFKGKEPIPAHLTANLQLSGLNDEFLLHDDILDFLEISPREEELVNGALVASRDVMHSIEQEILNLSSPDPNRMVLRIPPYPEDGAVIRDELYNALEYALGEHRLNRLLGAAQKDIESNFHLFGNAARTITFKHEYYEDSLYPQLVIHDAWVTNDEENRRHVQATSEAVAVVPEAYINFVPWLPADFWVPLEPVQ